MPLTPKFTEQSVFDELMRRRELINQVVTRSMSALGVKCVNHARTNRGYTDRTANLVNSTGFILLKDGVSIFEDFKRTAQGPEPTTVDGVTVGKTLAQEIAQGFSNYKGWVLIIVAGMDYASSVEYLHGKNVLAATELYLRKEIIKTIESIKRSISKMKV